MRSSEIRRVLSVAAVGVAIGAAGCGSSTRKTTSASTANPSTATKAYHAGEFCTKKKAALYRAQGFKCVKVKGSDRLEKS
ncbi:MAG: hypothetical protein JOY89_19560 [Solirubrobacterales bacterium]|nr:hypothetical protein [Solirubrobacterales bacterium]